MDEVPQQQSTKRKAKVRSDVILKIVVIGSAGSGKTCLVRRICGSDFLTDYLQTMGSELYVCSETVESKRGREGVTFKLWSCGGHMRYRPLLQPLFREAQCAIIVYDATSEDSFTDMTYWKNELQRMNEGMPFMVVGNKYDSNHVMISEQDGQVQV
eukprot:TRINITY_DN4538_c0_g1_i1.p1 TRINITY_DN4538_c0_g1~~TRINITY_DN4538_c0_g1_i1.p1  ORF type:complete len:156 (-),score=22.36 TRINITY_DN4538_c0_g1_i1:183-650(-)